MSLLSPSALPAAEAFATGRKAAPAVASAAWHSLLWLVVANAVGALIATLLLFPKLSNVLGEWTYGRWIMVHMNLELYGWCSLPMAGFLFKVYGADRESLARWCRPVLWVWSAALAVGAFSWLSGHSSGKLFLDWTGFARIFFPIAMLALWLLLAISFVRNWNLSANRSLAARGLKLFGLALLLAVPFAIYVASSPGLYPAINPDTGGPTGASQLESSLVIVAILLLIPLGLTSRKAHRSWAVAAAWILVTGELALCFALGRADISHHRPAQWISLGSLLVCVPLIPAYYAAFEWHASTRKWRIAFLCWWSVLVPTGWLLFLPGILDHFKFTDGLVGHSLLAMAGFVSSLLIFVMVQLLGEDGWIFNRTWSFYAWNLSVVAYVLLMFAAGWREGFDPSFTIMAGALRNTFYSLRLVVGLLILASSLEWLLAASNLLRKRESLPIAMPFQQEKTA
jgi:cytochrome c oxidase cbb3-type subunit 1